MTDQASDQGGPVEHVLTDTVGQIPGIANADAVVGPIQEKDGRIAIPLAKVSAGFGLGLGTGARADDGDGHSEGDGGGGGGGAKARPVAVVELTETELKVHQVVDSTRIAVASLVLAAWCVYWITHTVRSFRRR